MFDQTFLSPQVEQNAIISNKHGTYALPHKFPDDLRLRIIKIIISGSFSLYGYAIILPWEHEFKIHRFSVVAWPQMFYVIIYNFFSARAAIPYFKPNLDKLVPERVSNVCQEKYA